MERTGFRVNIDHIKKIEKQALDLAKSKKKEFIDFLLTFQKGDNVDLFNPSSNLQLQQLIYAPYKVQDNAKESSEGKKRNIELDIERVELMGSALGEEQIYENKTIRKPADLESKVRAIKVDNNDPTRGKNKLNMEITGLGIPAEKLTPQLLPSVDESILHILAGKPSKGKYGKALTYFQTKGEEEFGKKFCEGL